MFLKHDFFVIMHISLNPIHFLNKSYFFKPMKKLFESLCNMFSSPWTSLNRSLKFSDHVNIFVNHFNFSPQWNIFREHKHYFEYINTQFLDKNYFLNTSKYSCMSSHEYFWNYKHLVEPLNIFSNLWTFLSS